jgi:hypothetical protein
MELQYISDDAGNHTAVIIPIAEWNNLAAKHEDLKELAEKKKTRSNNAARFKGLLTHEEAEKYHQYLNGKPNKKTSKKPSDFKGTLSKEEAAKLQAYVKQSRNEWERNF